jgi:hypothetical protein
MGLKDQDPQVREEALKTLYRLRADRSKFEDSTSSVFKAIESLIEEYEEERS